MTTNTGRKLKRHLSTNSQKATKQALPAPGLVSGSWLRTVACENADVFEWEGLGRPLGPVAEGHLPGGFLRWGSMCSGSEGPHFAIAAMNHVLGRKGLHTLRHEFSCELSADKRKWIRCVNQFGELTMAEADSQWQIVGATGQDSFLPCIFEDMTRMNEHEADCWQHGQKCPVRSVDLLIVGTSCKDMSRANSSVQSRTNFCLSQATSRGGCAQTFHGLLAYVDAHRPLIILFENVDAMDDKAAGPGTNLDLFMSEMASRGYEGQPVMTDACQFGLPARRRRIYVLLVRVTGNPLLDFAQRSLTEQLHMFRNLLGKCLRTAPCASSILLDAKDPAVTAELSQRQAKAAGNSQSSLSGNWADLHMQFAESIKVRWGRKPLQELACNPWFKTLTPREQDALPLCQAQMPTSLLRDVSQSISRMNSATLQDDGAHISPTMMPKQALWVERGVESRLLLGREALTLQGFPANAFLKVLDRQRPLAGIDATFPTEALMSDLAGNAMAVPIVLAMLQAAFAALEWRQPKSFSCASETAPASEKERRFYCSYTFISEKVCRSIDGSCQQE